MNYNEYDDNELVSMINENSEDVKDALYKKYYYIIQICLNKYKKMGFLLNVDYKDLYQEAMLGFADALNRFNEDKEAGLPTFIKICVEGRLQVAIIKAGRIKNKVMNEALSLDLVYDKCKVPLSEMISDNNKNNPLDNLAKDEEVSELTKIIEESLSNKEKEVYELMLKGLNYQEIANLLDRNLKSVDNTIQRIKNKVKKILSDRSE